jgi:metallo-beta-lactamase class B
MPKCQRKTAILFHNPFSLRSPPGLGLIAGCLFGAFAVSAADKTTTNKSNLTAIHADDAAIRKSWDSWNGPMKPFRIIGNVYYVGMTGVSSFLIATPAGHILLDTGFEGSVPRIRDSVERLGFKLTDIKILLNSHAHLDHCGGHARIKELTGARIVMSEADAALLASGGTNDFTPYSIDMKSYPPAATDQLIHDGESVSLGGSDLICHLTPGHTKGCTTWTMDVREEGKVYHVLFFGSTTVLEGVGLVNNPKYPQITDDYAATFAKLKSLSCDVFLAPHAGFFDLAAKRERMVQGKTPNPFIDPLGYRSCIEKSQEAFQGRLKIDRVQVGG